jgi:hypothetical protein
MFATRAKTMTGMSSKSRSTLLPLVAATALGALPDSKADALMALAALEVVPTLGERGMMAAAKLHKLFIRRRAPGEGGTREESRRKASVESKRKRSRAAAVERESMATAPDQQQPPWSELVVTDEEGAEEAKVEANALEEADRFVWSRLWSTALQEGPEEDLKRTAGSGRAKGIKVGRGRGGEGSRVRVAGRKGGRLASEKRRASGGVPGVRQYNSEEVLRMYATTPELAEHVLFVDR